MPADTKGSPPESPDPREQPGRPPPSVASDRRFFDASPALLCTLDAGGRFTELNPAAQACFGYGPGDLRGVSCLDLLHPDDLLEARPMLARVLAGEPRVNLEARFRTREGRYRWLLFSMVPEQDGFIYGAGVDVSSRRDIETALAARLRQQTAVAQLGEIALREHALGPVADAATKAAAAALDAEFAALLWLSQDGEMLRLIAEHGLPPLTTEERDVSVGNASLSGYTLFADGPVIVGDLGDTRLFTPGPLLEKLQVRSSLSVAIVGRSRPFGVFVVLTRRPRQFSDDDARFLQALAHVIGAAGDEDRSAAELRERQAHLALARRVARIGTWQVELGPLTTPHMTWSDEVFRIFGVQPDEFAPTHDRFLERVHPDDRERVAATSQSIREGRTGFDMDFRIVRPDGSIRVVHEEAITEGGGAAAALRLIGTIEDITERSREEEARHATDELRRQAQKMEAVGRLAGGVAHDFNNLLAVISGYAQMLRNEIEPADPRLRRLEQIERAAQRATDLTRRLLTFSRQQPVEPRTIDLNAVVTELEPMLRRLIGEDIRLVIGLDHAACRVRADPGQVEQAIMNLVVNSRDAMPRGGRIAIETSLHATSAAAAGSVELRVADTGEGMPPEVQARVFEPFFTTKEKGKGTGLGLPMVFGIVEQASGRIELASAVGKGTTFRIRFPESREDDVAEAAEPDAPVEPARAGVTILVVEDENALREMVSEILREHGYAILEASDPAAALASARGHVGPIDLILSDVVMPGGTGPEVAARICDERPGTRVLFMSGYSDDALQNGRLEPGTVMLTKPFSTERLLTAVQDVLRAPV